MMRYIDRFLDWLFCKVDGHSWYHTARLHGVADDGSTFVVYECLNCHRKVVLRGLERPR